MRVISPLTVLVLALAFGAAPRTNAACDDHHRERLCEPGQKSSMSRRPINMQRVWMMAAIFDWDERRTTPAVVDIGFMDDDETRDPARECRVNYAPSRFIDNIDCAAEVYGEYDGVLLATGNDAYKRHGTNMKNIVAATLNDGGAAGVAGQVAVPRLYRLDDVQSYLFELPATIRLAVDHGSSVINISGGFPCLLLLNTPPNSQTPNMCTSAGRWSFCHAPGMVAAFPILSSLVCLGTELEGDLVANIADAAQYAQDHGVPIVGSAGNISTDWLTQEVDLTGIVDWTAANSDAGVWSIIPATVGPVIAAGAADTNSPYANQDFHGPRVNIWAPFTDTSPAAAFVSGLIALAQAANPSMSPLNEDLSEDELSELPGTFRDLLDSTGWTADELSALCGSDPECNTDPTGLRRNLVHPYRFMRTVTADVLPPFEALGYSDHFDSFRSDREFQNDALPGDTGADQDWRDAVTLRVPINGQDEENGSIFYIPGATPMVDQDWYYIEFEGDEAAIVDHRISLRYLSGYGELDLASPDDLLSLRETRLDGDETIKIFDTPPMAPGARLAVKVHGVEATDDNLYRLVVRRGPNVRNTADRFDKSGGNNNPASPDHNNEIGAATRIDPTASLSRVGSSKRHWTLGVDELTIHRTADRDWFEINVPYDPDGSLLYQRTLNVTTSPMIRLSVSISGEQPHALGQGGITYVSDQNLRLLAEPRHPGLVLDYSLQGSVTAEPVEYNAFPDKVIADLEFALEDMRRHVDDRLPESVGCVACLALAERGEIEVADQRHPVGGMGGVTRRARSLNYLIVEKTQRVDVALDGKGRGRLLLYDARGRIVARSGRDRRLSATLEPGAYLAVVAGGSGRAHRIGYTVRRYASR